MTPKMRKSCNQMANQSVPTTSWPTGKENEMLEMRAYAKGGWHPDSQFAVATIWEIKAINHAS